MFKSLVYHTNNLLGEVNIHPLNLNLNKNQNLDLSNGIRISHFSKPSERCSPLSVLHTISTFGVSFKMESEDSALASLYSACLTENKTAVMQLGEEELHLVAMSTRKNSELHSYFWCYIVSMRLYDSCLSLLNLRCLGIVFDLDETLVVANTMRSFEDRIEFLQRKVSSEMDPQRADGMVAEIKRYHDDKAILKQYLESDHIVDDGLTFKTQSEAVPALSDNYPSFVRPIIRLPEKNIILTRINPAIRDTSVLVRLRPAWEDLRNYLTARGRKRFEVYVCTMAEKDYALEMWRLLDPCLNLINSKELLDRIVCVKAGSRKSLLDVFHDSICHPKMSLVIDDRLKVWDEKDQHRVHVVPPFAPYYAPQAEVNNTIPVLCVARNVACNIRGGFFKEFDEGILQRLSDVSYEDDVPSIPSPDVGNYLVSEEDGSGSNNDPLRLEGISDVEVNMRLKDAFSAPLVVNDGVTMPAPVQLANSSNTFSQPPSQGILLPFQDKESPQVASPVKLSASLCTSQASLQGSPGIEEGELPESDLDPDTRRRLLIMEHGRDKRDQMSRDPPLPVRPPIQALLPPVQSHRSWSPLGEEMDSRQVNQEVPKTFPRKMSLGSEAMRFSKRRPSQKSYFHRMEVSDTSYRNRFENKRLMKEARQRDRRSRMKHSLSNHHSSTGEKSSFRPLVKSIKDSHTESGQDSGLSEETPLEVLQDIADKCGTKVEFKPVLIDSMELQFTVEVWLAREKIGEGTGGTRKEALHQAVECSISALANKFVSTVSPGLSSGCEKVDKLFQKPESDVLGDSTSFGHGPLLTEDPLPMLSTSEPSRFLEPSLEGSKKSEDSVSALKQLCFKEGLALMIKGQPTISLNSVPKEEEQAQVEIGGKVLGKGTGSTWEEAKIQAAEEALGNLKSMFVTQKRPSSPELLQSLSSKRLRPESSQVLHRLPSTRFS